MPQCSLPELHPKADLVYLERRIREESMATMASKKSQAEAEPKVLRMAELGARLAARRAELGLPDTSGQPESAVGRNSGANRTPSKRALLAEIEKLGGKW